MMGKGSESSVDTFSRSHPECPKCGLPTFVEGDGILFCASCEQTFDMKKDGLVPHVIEKRKGVRVLSIVIPVLLIIALLSVAVGILIYLGDDQEGRIDIYDVALVRDLEAERDVPVDHMEPSMYDDYIQSNLDDQRRRELWELERFYECMLVMDPDWDLVSLVENSSSSNVLAFYETESERITIIDDSNSEVYLNYILAHELTHALQDQNFDLDGYYPTGSYDEDMARLCAVEGDAMFTMELWAEETLSVYDRLKLSREIMTETFRTDSYYDLESSNEVISEMEYFPYLDGMNFVERIHADYGYDGVNALFEGKPPLSTEQVLHFEKYLEWEAPERIEMDLDEIGMDLAFESTAGEKLLTELLSDLEGRIEGLEGNRTGIGWGGDRFVYLENGSEFLSIFAIQWDTEEINDLFHFEYKEMVSWEGYDIPGDVTMVDGEYVKMVKEGRRTYVLRSDDLSLIDDALPLLD